MKAVRIHEFGQIPTIDDVPVPEIASGEVLVRVITASLNPLDALVVSGNARQFFTTAFPYTVGTDLCGIVEKLGPGVSDFQVGDAVIGWLDASLGGAMAEFAVVPVRVCTRLPASISPTEGAGIPIAGSTAWHALFSVAVLQPEETILIHAGAGGVGSFAVQFANKAGARVIATASGDGIALVRDLGADRVIDRHAEDFSAIGEHCDVVLDLVGGDTQARSYAVLAPGGRLVSTVMPPDQHKANLSAVTASIIYAKAYEDRLGEVVDVIAKQNIRTVVDVDVPLASFGEAWAAQAGGRARGKVIVRIGGYAKSTFVL